MGKTLIINSDVLGNGDYKIGQKTMGIFLRTLWANNDKPDTIVLYNTGVKLTVNGSMVLDALDGLSKADVDIISCVTCLNHFGLKDKVVVGRISDMKEIVATIMSSENVITI